jgi:hypothetical protein
MVQINPFRACFEQSFKVWIDDMALYSHLGSSLHSPLQEPREFSFLSAFGLVHHFYHEKSHKEQLIRASNYLNYIVGPTQSPLNH